LSRAVIAYVAPWLVDHPDELEIAEVGGENDSLILELSVHPEDVGKIIGKRGRIIRSLRAVARAAGHREGRSVSVEVVE
jgi:predicted RNA-binding protein YlqC (UPF0109 family)